MPGTNYQSELKQPPQPTARLALWSLVLLLCLPILMPLLLALVSVLMSLVWSTDAHAQALIAMGTALPGNQRFGDSI
ncbi:hypothetical protein AB8S08_04780 [Pseudidiomarina sp. PP-1MA]|uniref:Uncharacterized protein n=1 Tax=Pseudidiomarina sp. PP-1MA TaxID=3237706 RepID=A0AB39XA05_9GAMM